MPPEQRIGRRDRRDRLQGRTAQTVRPYSQPSTIHVGETRSAGPKLTPQETVLFDQVRDRFPLSAVQPDGEHAQHHLERRGVDHGAELTSRARLKDVSRELEHYGHTPLTFAGGQPVARAELSHVRWVSTAGTWFSSHWRPDDEFETDTFHSLDRKRKATS